MKKKMNMRKPLAKRKLVKLNKKKLHASDVECPRCGHCFQLSYEHVEEHYYLKRNERSLARSRRMFPILDACPRLRKMLFDDPKTCTRLGGSLGRPTKPGEDRFFTGHLPRRTQTFARVILHVWNGTFARVTMGEVLLLKKADRQLAIKVLLSYADEMREYGHYPSWLSAFEHNSQQRL